MFAGICFFLFEVALLEGLPNVTETLLKECRIFFEQHCASRTETGPGVAWLVVEILSKKTELWSIKPSGLLGIPSTSNHFVNQAATSAPQKQMEELLAFHGFHPQNLCFWGAKNPGFGWFTRGPCYSSLAYWLSAAQKAMEEYGKLQTKLAEAARIKPHRPVLQIPKIRTCRLSSSKKVAFCHKTSINYKTSII